MPEMVLKIRSKNTLPNKSNSIGIPSLAMKLRRLVSLCFVLFLGLTTWGATKIDRDLDLKQEEWLPIFVRMNNQLINSAGDYEKHCDQRSHLSRTQNQEEILKILQKKSRKSWRIIRQTIEAQEQKGAIRNLRRFWIVNGFSCLAQRSVIRMLSNHPEVSFIYLDRFTKPLRKVVPMDEVRKTRMQNVLNIWNEKKQRICTKIPWNVHEIGAVRSWNEENATGRGVLVAVIDSGILPSPPLIHALAKNPKEELNNRDDDGNGLIDDLFGYDFSLNTGYILDSLKTISHGSSCSGIIAGRASQGGWQTGIAPDSKLILIKGSFNLSAMEYLLLQGADIVSMSYMIVGHELGEMRGLFRNAFEHLSLAGVVAVGGAGNYGPHSRRAMVVGKQIGLPKDIPCVLAVGGVDKKRVQVSFSSEGPCFWEGVRFYSDYPQGKPLMKPDLTAFPTGYPVWNLLGSDQIRRDWKEVSKDEGASLVIGPAGNSFSGPHAAGVIALILSINPELNPWQVSKILHQTAIDLGEEGQDYKFGSGLIDALSAVRAAKKVELN